MAAICRRMGAPEPGAASRWCVLDAGTWRLRWERHTEVSTWTFTRPIDDGHVPPVPETALDLVPQDWLAALPGDVLVAAHVALLRARPGSFAIAPEDEIAASVAGGAAQIFSDFRAGPDAFTRFLIVQPQPDAALAGRLMQQVMEIESYRLLALLAFPLAGEAGAVLSRLEVRSADAAKQVTAGGGIEADRKLLEELATLAGEAQALTGRTGYRFAAARAYYGLVEERIRQLREERIGGKPMIAEFMERRLAPAMRTCAAVSERQQAVIAHIARTSQLLSTRVEVAAEATNASLLASMDRRAKLQLRLQQTVEGLSVAAISYYAVGLLSFVFKAAEHEAPGFDATLATGISAPIVILAIWLALRRMRRSVMEDE
jgi:uncharacterized membrane-anchored protein